MTLTWLAIAGDVIKAIAPSLCPTNAPIRPQRPFEIHRQSRVRSIARSRRRGCRSCRVRAVIGAEVDNGKAIVVATPEKIYDIPDALDSPQRAGRPPHDVSDGAQVHEPVGLVGQEAECSVPQRQVKNTFCCEESAA